MTTYGVDRAGGATGSGASSTVLLADGSVPLTANWDAGNFIIESSQFESDVPNGTPPFIVASGTKVDNLNSDLLDGFTGTYYLDFANMSGVVTTSSVIISGSGTIKFMEPVASGTNYSTLAAQAQAGNVDYTLPAAAPTVSGQALTATTGGVMSWTTMLPVGMIVDYGGTTAPTGWLLCYGQVVSQATYAALYAILGSTYGSDAGGNFTLPDLRGRVTVGQDDMGGSSANRLTGLSNGIDGDVLGATGGAESSILLTAHLAAHTHTQQGSFNSGTVSADHSHAFGANSGYQDSDHSHNFTDVYPNGGVGIFGGGGVTNTGQASTTAGMNSSHYHYTSGNTGGISANHVHGVTISGETASTGSASAHNNVQPSIVLNKIIYAGV